MTERNIPVIINNRNLVTWVQEMVRRIERFEAVGEIVIVDNASDYEPLLDWYETKPCRIVRLRENLGHYSPWSSGTVARFKSDSYVVTDPDMGLETTPDDTLLHLQSKLDGSALCKVGLGLDWESVPVDSPYYRHVQSYERSRWEASEVIDGVFTGVAIDTTFALYPSWVTGYCIGGGSLGVPYVAKHYPWYLTVEERTANREFMYYLDHANQSSSYKLFL